MHKKINTRSRMKYSNHKIKKFLIELGYHGFYMFPHTRFSKDYHILDMGFDMFCFDKNGKIFFIQCKTNMKCPKKVLAKFEEIESKYSIKCAWANRSRGKVEIYYKDTKDII